MSANTELKSNFIQYLQNHHRSISAERWESLISDNLLSPYTVQLPKSVLLQAQKFVQACFHLRESAQYQKAFQDELKHLKIKDPGNKSICMSYDFHLDASGVLKLIEVNTNAAFLALGHEMYKARGISLPIPDFDLTEIKSNIEAELGLQGKLKNADQDTLSISIIDEKPEEQRLYAEFLVFQSLFQRFGWNCEIANFDSVSKNVDFIYNRFTDFFLARAASGSLREKFLSREICFSPNPYEYFLLADKQRMIDWNNDELWNQFGWAPSLKDDIRLNLPKTATLSKSTSEEIWSDRKKYFLKPKRAFGSKQSYRGGTISRRAFDEITDQDFLAQEYIPAPEMNFNGEVMKTDLRFYAYQDRIQLVVARLYQGQVTNLKTTNGGFTPVQFL